MTNTNTEQTETRKGVYATDLPIDPKTLQQVIDQMKDDRGKTHELVAIAENDPVLIMDLLRLSNSALTNETREPITSIQAAFVRLGNSQAIDELNKLFDRENVTGETATYYFERHRKRGRLVGLTAKALAETIAPPLTDDAQCAGLLSCIGDLLATVLYGEKFGSFGERLALSSLRYKISTKLNFDSEKSGANYLRFYGIPQRLISALDEDASFSDTSKAILRPICFGAHEIVVAHEQGRLERFQPDKTLPGNSSLRLLGIQENQYKEFFSKACKHLVESEKEA